jgi:sarcosine oxidase delta subunit
VAKNLGVGLWRRWLTCGGMLEVSRDTVAAEEELLVSCAAEKNKYY